MKFSCEKFESFKRSTRMKISRFGSLGLSFPKHSSNIYCHGNFSKFNNGVWFPSSPQALQTQILFLLSFRRLWLRSLGPLTAFEKKICPDECFSGFQSGGPKFVKTWSKIWKQRFPDKFFNFSTNVWQMLVPLIGTPKNNRKDKFWTDLGVGEFLECCMGPECLQVYGNDIHSWISFELVLPSHATDCMRSCLASRLRATCGWWAQAHTQRTQNSTSESISSDSTRKLHMQRTDSGAPAHWGLAQKKKKTCNSKQWKVQVRV